MIRAIISGGGTGGHIFPAIAIADALKTFDPGIEILFIGAKGRMEMEKVPKAGYQIQGLWISGLQRKLTIKNLIFPIKVISSLISADRILSKFKPDVVIGVGGYASGPTLRAAVRRKIPTLIQEQNSFPGITNKILSRKVDKICVAYDSMERFFPSDKIILTGNPVRRAITTIADKTEALQHFHLKNDKKVVLIIGGSLGAGTINKSVLHILDQQEEESSVQFLWQTGKQYFNFLNSNQKIQKRNDVILYPFLDRMDLAYSAADIIVSRAGAIAISELCIIGKPAILIPSPNVAEDHQTKNAEALVNKSAALMLRDNESEDKLFLLVKTLINDIHLQEKLSRNIKAMAFPEAASIIAIETLKLIRKKRIKSK
jgi:UDP-N-acetylglucosamine--N-acetylmuramyl-(pentapeptide) pyrophosphoryl-undecaprenol N-acetylglucosamine transferase